jgi:hypothetical protein
MKKNVFYFPGSLGIEGQRRHEVLERREAQLSLGGSDLDETAFQEKSGPSVWSKEGERRKKWISRAEGAASYRMRLARTFLFDSLACGRSESLLILDPRKGFYALEALRRVPEGTVAVFLENEEAKTQLERLTSDLPELVRPVAALPTLPAGTWVQDGFGFSTFDRVILCEADGRHDPSFDYWAYAESALASARKGGSRGFVFFDILGGRSGFLSEMLRLNIAEPDARTTELILELEAFEKTYGSGPSLARGAAPLALPRTAKDAALNAARDNPETAMKTLLGHLKAAGVGGEPEIRIHCLSYERNLSPGDTELWLSTQNDYGRALRKAFGEADITGLRELLGRKKDVVSWPLFISLCIGDFRK